MGTVPRTIRRRRGTCAGSACMSKRLALWLASIVDRHDGSERRSSVARTGSRGRDHARPGPVPATHFSRDPLEHHLLARRCTARLAPPQTTLSQPRATRKALMRLFAVKRQTFRGQFQRPPAILVNEVQRVLTWTAREALHEGPTTWSERDAVSYSVHVFYGAFTQKLYVPSNTALGSDGQGQTSFCRTDSISTPSIAWG
jgi:hypothetical protein